MNEVPLDEKVERCGDYLEQAGVVVDASATATRKRIEAVVRALGDRLKLFSDILDADFFFRDEISYDEKNFAKRVAKDDVPARLESFLRERLEPLTDADWTSERLEAELNAFSEANGLATGLLIHALRLSTTGQAVGPGVFDCLVLVGRRLAIARIETALQKARA